MLKYLLITLFLFALVLISYDTSHFYVRKTRYERTGWRRFKKGFSIRELQEVMELTEDEDVIQGLSGVVLRRRVGYFLLLAFVVLAVTV